MSSENNCPAAFPISSWEPEPKVSQTHLFAFLVGSMAFCPALQRGTESTGTSSVSPANRWLPGTRWSPGSATPLLKGDVERPLGVTSKSPCHEGSLVGPREGGGYLIEDFIFNFHILTMWSLLYFYVFSPFSLQPIAGIGQSARAREWWHVSLHSQDGIFTAIASRVALLS